MIACAELNITFGRLQMSINKLSGFVLWVVLLSPGLVNASARDDVMVQEPFARAVASGISISAAYMDLHNRGSVDHALVRAESAIASTIELHEHVMSDGMLRMQLVNKILIPAGSRNELKPGGYHIMLIGLNGDLNKGDSFQVNLVFEDGSSKRITVQVRGVGAMK